VKITHQDAGEHIPFSVRANAPRRYRTNQHNQRNRQDGGELHEEAAVMIVHVGARQSSVALEDALSDLSPPS